jgi:putative transcriptional regulator
MALACSVLALLGGRSLAHQGVRPTAPSGSPPAAGKLLVAAPRLQDPNFARSVVLLVAYDGVRGAMGVIVNQPTPIELARVLPAPGALAGRGDRVWRGGPVLPSSLLTLIRTKEELADTETVFDDVRMLLSREAFERVLESRVPAERLRAFAGHAGWAPGQLEAEIARGDWTVVPATAATVFSETPEETWPRLQRRSEGQWTSLEPGNACVATSRRQAICRDRAGLDVPTPGSPPRL